MARKLFAYSWRTGRVDFGPTVPEGALEIARDYESRLRKNVTPACRLAYDNETLLVPGVPEADSDDEALDAILKFRDWIRQRSLKFAERRAA